VVHVTTAVVHHMVSQFWQVIVNTQFIVLVDVVSHNVTSPEDVIFHVSVYVTDHHIILNHPQTISKAQEKFKAVAHVNVNKLEQVNADWRVNVWDVPDRVIA